MDASKAAGQAQQARSGARLPGPRRSAPRLRAPTSLDRGRCGQPARAPGRLARARPGRSRRARALAGAGGPPRVAAVGEEGPVSCSVRPTARAAPDQKDADPVPSRASSRLRACHAQVSNLGWVSGAQGRRPLPRSCPRGSAGAASARPRARSSIMRDVSDTQTWRAPLPRSRLSRAARFLIPHSGPAVHSAARTRRHLHRTPGPPTRATKSRTYSTGLPAHRRQRAPSARAPLVPPRPMVVLGPRVVTAIPTAPSGRHRRAADEDDRPPVSGHHRGPSEVSGGCSGARPPSRAPVDSTQLASTPAASSSGASQASARTRAATAPPQSPKRRRCEAMPAVELDRGARLGDERRQDRVGREDVQLTTGARAPSGPPQQLAQPRRRGGVSAADARARRPGRSAPAPFSGRRRDVDSGTDGAQEVRQRLYASGSSSWSASAG